MSWMLWLLAAPFCWSTNYGFMPYHRLDNNGLFAKELMYQYLVLMFSFGKTHVMFKCTCYFIWVLAIKLRESVIWVLYLGTCYWSLVLQDCSESSSFLATELYLIVNPMYLKALNTWLCYRSQPYSQPIIWVFVWEDCIWHGITIQPTAGCITSLALIH